jgi:hypothetical protein
MLDDLRTFLMADADVLAAASTRIYPTALPQKPSFPAATYNVISATRSPTMQHGDVLPSKRLQIDAWGSSFADAQELGEAIRVALDGYRGDMGDTTVAAIFADTERTSYESEPKLYRVSRDYFIWHYE